MKKKYIIPASISVSLVVAYFVLTAVHWNVHWSGVKAVWPLFLAFNLGWFACLTMVIGVDLHLDEKG